MPAPERGRGLARPAHRSPNACERATRRSDRRGSCLDLNRGVDQDPPAAISVRDGLLTARLERHHLRFLLLHQREERRREVGVTSSIEQVSESLNDGSLFASGRDRQEALAVHALREFRDDRGDVVDGPCALPVTNQIVRGHFRRRDRNVAARGLYLLGNGDGHVATKEEADPDPADGERPKDSSGYDLELLRLLMSTAVKRGR